MWPTGHSLLPLLWCLVHYYTTWSSFIGSKATWRVLTLSQDHSSLTKSWALHFICSLFYFLQQSQEEGTRIIPTLQGRKLVTQPVNCQSQAFEGLSGSEVRVLTTASDCLTVTLPQCQCCGNHMWRLMFFKNTGIFIKKRSGFQKKKWGTKMTVGRLAPNPPRLNDFSELVI